MAPVPARVHPRGLNLTDGNGPLIMILSINYNSYFMVCSIERVVPCKISPIITHTVRLAALVGVTIKSTVKYYVGYTSINLVLKGLIMVWTTYYIITLFIWHWEG